MKNFLKSTPLALGVCAALVLLAGCGGSQTGTPGSMPQNLASVAHVTHGGSWMKPGTSGGDLLYVSSPQGNSVSVFTYPGGSLVGTLTGFKNLYGLCSDANGNVWMTNYTGYGNNGYLLEYAHGGTSPIATLAYSGVPQDCAWDPTTGNLAVIGGALAIYSNASGSPTYYSYRGLQVGGIPLFISYDGSGNVYFAGTHYRAAWLPKGGSTLMRFYLKLRGGFAWDGTYFTVEVAGKAYRYSPSAGRSGKPVGSVSLNGICCKSYDSIEDGLLAITQRAGTGYALYVYDYPQGGSPTLTLSGLSGAFGVAISVAPPGLRIHK